MEKKVIQSGKDFFKIKSKNSIAFIKALNNFIDKCRKDGGSQNLIGHEVENFIKVFYKLNPKLKKYSGEQIVEYINYTFQWMNVDERVMLDGIGNLTFYSERKALYDAATHDFGW